jgi:sedoheptulokinase
MLLSEGAMGITVGLDVGTTTLSAVVLDVAAGRLLARRTVPNSATVSDEAERAKGRAELDLNTLRELLIQALGEIVAAIGSRAREVVAIGVTGQMHGVALLRPDTTPVGYAITWQDRRVLEPHPAGGTYLEQFIARAGGPQAFEPMGCSPWPGYLGLTLFWLQENGRLPRPPVIACFIPDAAVSFLTGLAPVTDPTDGGGSALMNLVERRWDWSLIARLGLPAEIIPPVRESGEVAGTLLPAIAAQVGLPQGTPVTVAIGDNQASFLGSVAAPWESVLVNVGTGAQISALTPVFRRLPGLEMRYFPGGRYLLVGAGLFGGRTYAYLRSFFRQVGAAFFGGSGEEELYDQMTRLAAQVPPGCDGLRCAPFFTGTRQDTSLRASYTGLAPHNFTPGHLIRATLEGMAEVFHNFWETMRPVVGERSILAGSGNGLRRNPLLGEILSQRFGLPLQLSMLEEEAATGAALLAAVGVGAIATWDEASALLGSAATKR